MSSTDSSSRSIHLGSYLLGHGRRFLLFLDHNFRDKPPDFLDMGAKRRFDERIKCGDTDSIVIPIGLALEHDLRQLEEGREWQKREILSKYPENYAIAAEDEFPPRRAIFCD